MSMLPCIKYCLLVGFLGFLTSCVASKNSNGESSSSSTTINVTEEDPKILFVGYKFDGDAVKLDFKKIVEGKMKAQDMPVFSDVGDLILRQLDDEGVLLDETLMQNPRIKSLEYVNDDGALSYKQVEDANAEFAIRVQLWPGVKSLHLVETVDIKKTSLLHELKL